MSKSNDKIDNKKYKIDKKMSIFEKSDAIEPTCIDKDTLMELLPKINYPKPQTDLRQKYEEWRFRFLDIKGQPFIEISKLDLKQKRLFINNQTEWTDYKVPAKYDRYVTKIIYAYPDNMQ